MKLKLLYYLVLFSVSGICQSSFFTKDWKTIIDTTWGVGLPTDQKLAIFDSVWNMIDWEYACFHNLELDWNAERDRYRPEIENGISRGRFAAILNHLSLKLKETHTYFFDVGVNTNITVAPGVPIIFTGGWGLDTSFSAGLYPLPDSSLLVYTAPSNHPLDLEPGDVILGYDGIPWKILYRELLNREFPIALTLWGSNDKAFTHCWLTGAGKNWHLFDTIDIKKYSGDIVHLPTNLLVNNNTQIIFSEQLPVPGIPIDSHWKMTWGIVEGTNIGYLYIYSWFDNNIGINFYNALDSLINIYNVEGLIFDFRANTGGHFERTNNGLRLLFNSDVPDLGLARRNDPFNHYSLSTFSTYGFTPDTSTFFNKPIAVLSGPLSISASDFLIKRLRSHPKVKVFGKTSSSAFASQKQLQMNEFIINYAYLNGWSEENPNEYLTHLEQPVDFEISFTPDDVRNGYDTVVKTALEWIKNVNGIEEDIANISDFKLSQNYPNPFNPETKIEYYISKATEVNFIIYDVLGSEVMKINHGYKYPGNYVLKINASNLSSSVYFYKIEAGNFVSVKKMILVK